MAYIYDETGIAGANFAIDWSGNTFAIFRTDKGAGYARSLETYDDLSLAIYRVRYLCRGVTKGFAAESVKLADKIIALGAKKAHNAWLGAD
ncbi:MAG: hypothetical protein KGI54_16140 [Pseudomonadota bacterium]|nr:hypothetical protein [Pseudomonadota bacterium]